MLRFLFQPKKSRNLTQNRRLFPANILFKIRTLAPGEYFYDDSAGVSAAGVSAVESSVTLPIGSGSLMSEGTQA
jgi:hypothetical protein